jgi:hypothetical protein
LRAEGPHVERGDAVAPDLDLDRRLDAIDRDVQGEHAGRAQDQLVGLERRRHERQARQLALADEAPGGIDDDPFAIEVEPGLGDDGLARRRPAHDFTGWT